MPGAYRVGFMIDSGVHGIKGICLGTWRSIQGSVVFGEYKLGLLVGVL